ncbi:uncharacterized protein LOC144144657 [Haemaphysalis longicornis]
MDSRLRTLVTTLLLLRVPVAYAANVCLTPPAPALMMKVLRPTAKILLDCVADVILLYKANVIYLTRVVTTICEYHTECYKDVKGMKDVKKRREIAAECMVKNLMVLFPSFESSNGAEGIEIVQKLMACIQGFQGLNWDDANVTNAIMHWIYEVLRTDIR